MSEQGHNYTFGAPSKGWPTFAPDGGVVRECGCCRELYIPNEPCSCAYELCLDGKCRS
jgi:hypothetical protein